MELKRISCHYDAFEINFERDIKAYFRLISSLMKSQGNFGKIATKCRVELLLVLYFWDTEYLVHCPFGVLQGLREKKYKFIPDRKYIANFPSDYF